MSAAVPWLWTLKEVGGHSTSRSQQLLPPAPQVHALPWEKESEVRGDLGKGELMDSTLW